MNSRGLGFDTAQVFALPEFDVGFTDRVILLADRRQGHALGAVEGPLRLELAAWADS